MELVPSDVELCFFCKLVLLIDPFLPEMITDFLLLFCALCFKERDGVHEEEQ